MAAAVAARAGLRRERRSQAQPVHRWGPPGRPVWSADVFWRAPQAAVVISALFVLCLEAIGDKQMATYVAFGGFATLVFAGFEGSRWDKDRAHLVLAVAVSADLADAFHRGADYLQQATAWALGFRSRRPNTAPAAVPAASELEDGLRQFHADRADLLRPAAHLAEQRRRGWWR